MDRSKSINWLIRNCDSIRTFALNEIIFQIIMDARCCLPRVWILIYLHGRRIVFFFIFIIWKKIEN